MNAVIFLFVLASAGAGGLVAALSVILGASGSGPVTICLAAAAVFAVIGMGWLSVRRMQYSTPLH